MTHPLLLYQRFYFQRRLLSSFAFSCCDKHQDPEQHGEETLYFTLQSIIKGLKPRWKLKGGAEAKTMGERTAYWLVPHGSFCLLFHTTQDHLLKSGTVHRKLGLPTWVIDQEDAPTQLPSGQSDGGTF